jgi:hypothetical protein
MFFWKSTNSTNSMDTKELITYAVLIVTGLSVVCLCACAPFWLPDTSTSRQIIAQNLNANSNMLSRFQANNLRTGKLLKPKSDLIGALLERNRLIGLEISDLRLWTLDGTIGNGIRRKGKMKLISNISDTFHVISDLQFQQTSLILEQADSCDKVIKLRKIKKKFTHITNENLQEALAITTWPVFTLFEHFKYRTVLNCNSLFLNYSIICNSANDYYLWRLVFRNFNYVIYAEQVLDYRSWLSTSQLANPFGSISELTSAVKELHFYTHFLFESHRTPIGRISSDELLDHLLDLNDTALLDARLLRCENLRLIDEIAVNNRNYDALMLDIFKK